MSGETAGFGIWWAPDEAHFQFVRWLKESECPPDSSLEFGAWTFLQRGGPRGAELRPGRYMIQRLNRGASARSDQCLVFDAVSKPQPLELVVR